MTTTPPTIVLVGHCGPDTSMIISTVERALPGAEIVRVNDERELEPHLHGNAVLLVNRVLDGPFSAEDGIDLIATVAQRDDPPAALLVSNFAEAQAAAEAAGARPGFGKADLFDAETAERIRAAVG